MEPTSPELQTRIRELEDKVKSLDKQVRSRNSTLACVLATCGGSVRVSAPVMKQVMEDYAGATFRTVHDTDSNEFVVTAQMMPKAAVAS